MEEQIKEYQDVKYIREIQEYYDAYMFALINEIYVGVGMALGLSESEAYRIAKTDPKRLEKAGFFKAIFEKFKSIFPHRVKKFRPSKGKFGDGKPLTEQQWTDFNRKIEDYWREHANRVTEDIAVKTFMLGRETAQFRKKKKPYKNKSLYQVVDDQYDGKMPSTIAQAYKKYDFTNAERNVLEKSFSNVAMYVTKTNNEVEEAIRHQVQSGIQANKSPIEIASDLYWNVQKDEELVNKYTAESLRRNWHRVAATEVAAVYEAGILAPHESDAMESLKDPGKAQYFVRLGGTCKWCQSKQGTLVRLIPASIVENAKDESLSAMGIKDPNTDIAIWAGKNNVGLKQGEWNICCPGHPYNVATFGKIDLKTEWYNPKTKEIERRQEKQKFVPQMEDYSYRSKEEKEYRKPTKVANNLVRYNENIYEAVSKDEYNRKLEEWRKDPSRPIPVNESSPSYKRIFEAAQ